MRASSSKYFYVDLLKPNIFMWAYSSQIFLCGPSQAKYFYADLPKPNIFMRTFPSKYFLCEHLQVNFICTQIWFEDKEGAKKYITF